MITNAKAYRELCEDERWEKLRKMSPEESLSVAEALLTSEIMEIAEFPDDDRPVSLAIALGIRRALDPQVGHGNHG
jgi:hypothetical protein